MSKSQQNSLVKLEGEHFNKGNKHAAITYDEKLIRDELKSNIYRAVRGLNMTPADADKYYQRADVTVIEKLFYDAAKAKHWSVIERFFDRVIGVPAIKQTADVNPDAHEKRDLSKLNQNELEQLRNIQSKLHTPND